VVRRVAARDEQRIVLLRTGLVDAGFGLGRDLTLLAPQLLTGLEADNGDLVTLVLQRVGRLLELGILKVAQPTRARRWSSSWYSAASFITP
jgi:hypothetical protein